MIGDQSTRIDLMSQKYNLTSTKQLNEKIVEK